VAAGLRVGIVDLTRGELGTRGTAEIRAREAAAAGEVLGVTYRENLGLPDGRLEADETSRRLVIEAVRRSRARLVVAPAPVDLHPDHATTGRIVERVRYLCPMPKYPAEGEAHRPSIWLWTMHHTEVAPAIVVDVSDVFERKLEAVRCFASQLHDPDVREEGPGTGIGRPDFLEALIARHRHWGSRIGVRYGEPYGHDGPLPVRQLGAFWDGLVR
jgi:bacillithiol biosynthesis deacetylase BshB1